ncbi:hypothetical protein DV26_35730 [Amycolatopsis mediterranei]|nr:hypothetical protein DV26_35730 [Amycolatopsis mediterranei]KDU88819.1 hypothetical protein DV36_28150 [Amycolatopsis mediterranei]
MTVLGGPSCMRMIWPSASLLLACTIASTLTPLQSPVLMSQMISRRPYFASTDRTVELLEPNGGRNSFGVPPPAFAMACWVREISESICALPGWVRCGCV